MATPYERYFGAYNPATQLLVCHRDKNRGSKTNIKLFHCSYFSGGSGKGEHSRVARMASSAATLKIRSVLNLKLLSTLALSTRPSRSNDTIMSTMRVSLPAAPIGGSQHFDKCARNRSISDNPSGPTTGLSGAFKTSPAAALRLSFSFSAAFLCFSFDFCKVIFSIFLCHID